jgi:hypothetical protein
MEYYHREYVKSTFLFLFHENINQNYGNILAIMVLNFYVWYDS